MEISGGIQASLPGRYATALFELARDAKAIEAVEASLNRVSEALRESDMFRRLVASPLVSRTDAAKAVAATASALQLDPQTTNFLGVLATNRRLGQLAQVIRAFRMLAAAHRGETTAEVASAAPNDPPDPAPSGWFELPSATRTCSIGRPSASAAICARIV